MDFSYFIMGLTLGLAGFTPGPLSMLIIGQTLKHNFKEGVKVALAPLIADGPIIVIALTISSLLIKSSFYPLVWFSGGLFLIYLGWDQFQIKKIEVNDTFTIAPRSLKKGILTSILNPISYFFWFTVGAPTMLQGIKVNFFSGLLFIPGFYITFLGIKLTKALLAKKSKKILQGIALIICVRFISIILIVFSLKFLYEGFKTLGLM